MSGAGGGLSALVAALDDLGRESEAMTHLKMLLGDWGSLQKKGFKLTEKNREEFSLLLWRLHTPDSHVRNQVEILKTVKM